MACAEDAEPGVGPRSRRAAGVARHLPNHGSTARPCAPSRPPASAHTVGQDDWTTLPDQNGHTTSDFSNDLACTGGWSNPDDPANVLHPFLTHYQTFDPATGTGSPTGTTGQWNAANGSSSGWQRLQFDLSAYAVKQVEVSITSVSDWGFQQFPGVFVDDIETPTGCRGRRGAPSRCDSAHQGRRDRGDRRHGLHGLRLEGITGAATRNQVMDRVIDYPLR